MKYGYFDDSRREYVITNPRTPVKWINYIGTIEFGGFVDHTGGALLCCGDPALNRITRYISILPNSEMKGTSAYLRLKQKGEYTLLSPYYLPNPDGIKSYECRIGTQYLVIRTDFGFLQTEITIFVPVGEKVEIRDIRITNTSDAPISCDLVPVVEYSHFDALKQLTNADWVPQTMQSEVLSEDNGNLVLTQYAFMHRENRINFFTANRPASSFETDRRLFLGSNEYGSWAAPESFENPELPGSEAKRGDNIAALMIHLNNLGPGQTERIITMLGQAASPSEIRKTAALYSRPEAVDAALAGIKEFWDDHLSFFNTETPDARTDTMLNIHNPRQCYITKNWARYLSIYQTGYGSRGIGFRDACQDVCGIISQKPAEAENYLLDILKSQKPDGSAMHQYNPLTMEATAGETAEMPNRPQFYGDDHLWAVYAVCSLIKETGDPRILSKILPFYDADDGATVMEHLIRALDFTAGHLGSHGLPLLGFADWNDTVNLPKGAESVFIAGLYGFVLKEMIGLLDYTGGTKKLREELKNRYDCMKERFNEAAWDGSWYLRYFDHRGEPVGSASNTRASIFSNAQSWAVMSGFADSLRATAALDAVHDRLATEYGIKLMSPGYNGYDPEKGGVTTYPPGAKENAGIFLHANPWVIIAETMTGRGDRAFQYYSAINPAAKNDCIDIYECEPYCYAQNILSDEHPCFGLGRNSWLTGTAAWAYRAATEYILGIRPVYEGLMLDPCIPSSWPGYRVIRKFRGLTYRINVSNPGRISNGDVSISVNGKALTGNIIREEESFGSVDIVDVSVEMIPGRSIS